MQYQHTKSSHVTDFNQSYAWILYIERRLNINIIIIMIVLNLSRIIMLSIMLTLSWRTVSIKCIEWLLVTYYLKSAEFTEKCFFSIQSQSLCPTLCLNFRKVWAHGSRIGRFLSASMYVILNHSCSTQVRMQGYKLINCRRTKTTSWKIFEWSILWRCLIFICLFVCLFIFIERNTKSLVISKWRSKGIFVKVIQCTSISVSR